MTRTRLVALLALLTSVVAGGVRAGSAPREEPLRFAVTLSEEAAAGISELGLDTPVDGRVFVIISRSDRSEPREQVEVTGVPFWGMDVLGWAGGERVVLDTEGSHAAGAASPGGVTGYPVNRFSELPPGEYWVQPFVNVYTTFERADGHTVRLHMNSGAGQSTFRAPGNATAMPRRMQIDPAHGGTIELVIDRVLPPRQPLTAGQVLQQGNPRDREQVKFVKIRSALLSDFWGRDMYIGANVLLPANYDATSDRRYPTLYLQGHFPGGRAPLGYDGDRRGGDSALREFWHSAAAPRMFAVTIRDANPYYDTSYSVDSANIGPYGAAITEELIPHLEQRFRMIPEAWARVTAGGSTGGWEALAAQIFYPRFFGGAWGWCPDPVDFNYHQIVGIYEDDNAYYTGNEWHRIERPNARRPDGNIVSTVRQENHMEQAWGPGGISGGQWAVWQAVFGPVGSNGLPLPIWDPVTGAIDHEVADYWRAHFDLNQYLRDRWSDVGPDLRGKLHVATGDMDTYYLEEAVFLLEDFLESVESPPAEATFEYGWREPHCWIGYSPTGSGEELTYAEFLDIAARHIAQRAPEQADLHWLPLRDPAR
jgi:hypothetical protein